MRLIGIILWVLYYTHHSLLIVLTHRSPHAIVSYHWTNLSLSGHMGTELRHGVAAHVCGGLGIKV